MKQTQVKQHTGQRMRFSIDPESAHSMRRSQILFEDKGESLSLTVIVRRALRVYHSYLMKLTPSTDSFEAELLETKRAAKGVR